MREPVGIAYLLARVADTIADTRLLPPKDRLRYLLAFRAMVEGPASPKEIRHIQDSLRQGAPTSSELALINSLPQAFGMLVALPETDRDRVRSIVTTLTHGMEIDLKTFPLENPYSDSVTPVAFKDPAELDRYVYYVAGCVGEFWTAITTTHSELLAGCDLEHMSELGVRFGKGLQLTNILRDLPRDLRFGRCYLPSSELAASGLTPADLLNPTTSNRARPLLVRYLEITLGHYEAAEQYILAIPRRSPRLRLAILWPVLIGLATLRLLAHNPGWINQEKRIKVSRGWIYRMMCTTQPAVMSNRVLRFWMARIRRQVADAL